MCKKSVLSRLAVKSLFNSTFDGGSTVPSKTNSIRLEVPKSTYLGRLPRLIDSYRSSVIRLAQLLQLSLEITTPAAIDLLLIKVGSTTTDISSTTLRLQTFRPHTFCLQTFRLLMHVYKRVGQLYIQLLFQQIIIFINSNFYLYYDSFFNPASTYTM